MSPAPPRATGTLQATPFAHLLVYLLDHHLSGTLVLEEREGGKHALALEGGVPTKVKAAESVVYLGQVLLELGAIDQATYDRTLERVTRERLLHGQVLLTERAIDLDTLLLGLREQVMRTVTRLFRLPATTVYGFYDGVNYLERWGGAEPVKVVVPELLARGLRDEIQESALEATLARLGPRTLRLHARSRVALFKLDARESAVVDMLRAKPQPLSDLTACGVGSVELVRRVIYLLSITRHLDLAMPEQQPLGVEPIRGRHDLEPAVAVGDAAPHPPSAVVPPAAAAAPAAPESSRVLQMRARAQEMAGQNYYQILGVDPTADGGSIQAAFFLLAKQWHPDRLTGEIAVLRDEATRAFARMTEAHQVLADPDRRADYDRLLKEGGGSAEEQEQVARVLQAVGHFQKAEVLLKKGKLEEAEVEARAAAEGDPEQPEYIALHAWVLAQTPARVQSGKYDDLIAQLDRVLKQQPTNERAHMYRAQLLKRAGHDARAVKDFIWVAENNPRNLEAAREVRLHRMRKGEDGSSGGGKRDSLFGKLFKR